MFASSGSVLKKGITQRLTEKPYAVPMSISGSPFRNDVWGVCSPRRGSESTHGSSSKSVSGSPMLSFSFVEVLPASGSGSGSVTIASSQFRLEAGAFATLEEILRGAFGGVLCFGESFA